MWCCCIWQCLPWTLGLQRRLFCVSSWFIQVWSAVTLHFQLLEEEAQGRSCISVTAGRWESSDQGKGHLSKSFRQGLNRCKRQNSSPQVMIYWLPCPLEEPLWSVSCVSIRVIRAQSEHKGLAGFWCSPEVTRSKRFGLPFVFRLLQSVQTSMRERMRLWLSRVHF